MPLSFAAEMAAAVPGGMTPVLPRLTDQLPRKRNGRSREGFVAVVDRCLKINRDESNPGHRAAGRDHYRTWVLWR